MRRERIASVVTALALVLAAVGGGLGPTSVTQTASAEFVDCQLNDSIIAAGLATMTADTSGCYWDPGLQGDYENMTEVDAYSSALSVKDSTDSYTTTTGNFLENGRSIAYQKAKIDVVQNLENGTAGSQAKFEANQTVDDYYTRIEIAALKDYNNKIRQIRYLENQTALSVRGFDPSSSARSGPINGYTEYNATLVNGTTHKVILPYTGTEESHFGPEPYLTEYSEDTATTVMSGDLNELQAQSPDTGNYTQIMAEAGYNAPAAGDYTEIVVEVRTQSQQVKDNMDQYVDGVYSQYNAGELNATTLYQNDPTLLAQEAGTSWNSTGYYGYAAAQLASIGYAGDLIQSHVVQINGGNYTGTLFYSGAGQTEFQTGQSYDFGNYSGNFYMAASDTPTNETGIVRLDDKGSSFEIVEATNTQTGESVNKTVTQKYVYESANATALQSEIDRLEELREFYEEQASAGGGVGINLGTEDKAIIGVIGAVVLVLALRD